MITTIRKTFKTKAYKIFLWIVLLALGGAFSAIELVRMIFAPRSGASWVMEVNGSKIYKDEFIRAAQEQEIRLKMMRAQYGQYADLYFQLMGISTDPGALALNTLVRRTLLNQVAAQLPLRVDGISVHSALNTPVFVQQELSDLAPFSTWDFQNGGINQLALREHLARFGLTTQDFDKEVVAAIKRQDVQRLVELSAYVPLFDLRQQFSQNFLGHKFSIMKISPDEILKTLQKEAISDEKIKAYFDLRNSQNKQYYVPEKRSASAITFNAANYGIPVSEQEIEKYYNNNKAQFIDQPAQVQVRRIVFKVADAAQEREVQEKAQALQQELKANPASFAQKAKELSQDAATAANGGLVPAFSKGTHDATFEKSAFLLKDDNDISSAIRTKDGFEILQRVNKKAQTFKPLASVSKNIQEILRNKKFASVFPGDARAALAKGDSAALATFVKDKNGQEKNVVDATLDDTALNKTIFKLKDQGSTSYVEGTTGTIVIVKSIQPTHAPTFDAVKNKVKEDFLQYETQERINQILQEIEKDPQSFDQKRPGMGIVKTDWISKENGESKMKDTLKSQGIFDRLFQIENVGAIATMVSKGTGYALRLDEVAPFNQTLFDEKKKALQEAALQQNQNLVMAGFVASLYRNAKINKNESQIKSES